MWMPAAVLTANDLTAIDVMLRASEMAFGSLVHLNGWI